MVPIFSKPSRRSSRGKKKSAGSDDSDDEDDHDDNNSDDNEEEEERPTKKSNRRSGEKKDSDAENNEFSPKSKPAPSKRAESSVDAPEYVTTPSSGTPTKGRLADDFDYGDGSLEDMQRLMKLYQKDGSSSSTSSAPGPGSKGKVSQSILSSTVDDFGDSPPKLYSAPKRGRPPARNDSPSSPQSEAEDVPDPAAEWLRSFRLGCKECDVEEFASDNLFVQHHLETHQDDRPYKCQNLEKDHVTPKAHPDCNSSFRQRHHYKEHIRGKSVKGSD